MTSDEVPMALNILIFFWILIVILMVIGSYFGKSRSKTKSPSIIINGGRKSRPWPSATSMAIKLQMEREEKWNSRWREIVYSENDSRKRSSRGIELKWKDRRKTSVSL